MTLNVDTKWVMPFLPPVTEPSCLGTTQIMIRPREPLSYNTQVFNFDLPTLGERFPVLSSMQLFVKGSVKRSDGTKLAKAEKVAIANNSIHSLFSTVSAIVGENQTKLTYRDYPYIALLKVVDTLKRNDQRLPLLWFQPDNGLTLPDHTFVNFKERMDMCAESKSLHLLGHLQCDIADMTSYLLKNTPFSIQLEKSSPKCHIDASTTDQEYAFFIDDISFANG